MSCLLQESATEKAANKEIGMESPEKHILPCKECTAGKISEMTGRGHLDVKRSLASRLVGVDSIKRA